MFDFFRVGFPESSRALTDPNPRRELAKKCGTSHKEIVDGYVAHAAEKYADDNFDTTRFRRMQEVAFWNTGAFFRQVNFIPMRHKGLPMAAFLVDKSTFGISEWIDTVTDTSLGVFVYDFEARPAYKEIFKTAPWMIRQHNLCMVHDE